MSTMNELFAKQQIVAIDFTSLQVIPEIKRYACYIANNFRKETITLNPLSDDLIDFVINHFLAKHSILTLPPRRVCFPIAFHQNQIQENLIAVLSCDEVSLASKDRLGRIIQSYVEHDTDPTRLKAVLYHDQEFLKLVKTVYLNVELIVFIPRYQTANKFTSPDLYDILKHKLQESCCDALPAFKLPNLLAIEFANIDFCLCAPEDLTTQVHDYLLHGQLPPLQQVIADYQAQDETWLFKFSQLKKTKVALNGFRQSLLTKLRQLS